MPARPLPRDELEAALCWNMVVPPQVRASMFAQEIDSDEVLASVDVPVMVTHGRADTVAPGRPPLMRGDVTRASLRASTGLHGA